MNSNIELKENLNTWSKEHQLKAVKDVLKENSNIKFDIIKINKLNDIDFLIVAIYYSYEKYNEVSTGGLNEFINYYAMDSRKKIKLVDTIELFGGGLYYTIQYKKISYCFDTRTLRKIELKAKELLKE